MILNQEHLTSDTKDVPCTYSINFKIRNNELIMTVHMRSQDAIFGLGNDLPSFSIIHEMVYICLRDIYSELKMGDYYHTVDSFHIYEKHFKFLGLSESSEFVQVECPKILNSQEVNFLQKFRNKNIPEQFKFTQWLNEL